MEIYLNRLSKISKENGTQKKGPDRGMLLRGVNMHAAGEKRIKKIKRNGVASRGNSFVGQYLAEKVVVKIHPVKNRTKGVGVGAFSGAKNLYHHIRYINRAGAGINNTKAPLFDGTKDKIKGNDFYRFCKNDRHHFRMIVSPERGYLIKDFQKFIQSLMNVLETDLGTKLRWISAIHYDTDDIHAHVIIQGRKSDDTDLVIGRDFISAGIRARAQELAIQFIGY